MMAAFMPLSWKCLLNENDETEDCQGKKKTDDMKAWAG